MEISTLRKRRNMTQRELASRVGVSPGCVAKWENGAMMPRAELLPKLADIFDCNIDELFGRKPA